MKTSFNRHRHTAQTGTEAAHCAGLPPAQTGTTGTRVFRRVPCAVGVTRVLKMNIEKSALCRSLTTGPFQMSALRTYNFLAINGVST
jgi:hypothetical protein